MSLATRAHENVSTFFDQILERSISGYTVMGFQFKSAKELSDYYMAKHQDLDLEMLIKEVIRNQAKRSFAVGFLTSLGGFSTLPIQLSAGVAGALVLQIRLIAVISHLNGLNIETKEVRTLIKLLTVGSIASESIKDVLVNIGAQITLRQLNRIPSATLRAINKLLGVRLITKAGEKSVTSFARLVPIVGGLVGGGIDSFIMHKIGHFASKELGIYMLATNREPQLAHTDVTIET